MKIENEASGGGALEMIHKKQAARRHTHTHNNDNKSSNEASWLVS